MGSILEIMPFTDYSRFVPKESDEDRMRAIWVQVGNDLRCAIDQYSDVKNRGKNTSAKGCTA